MRNFSVLLLLMVGLFGCMIGPDYKRPQIDTPQAWRFADASAQDVANTRWWEQFNDPVLNDLIQVALKENKDVLIAAARIEDFSGRLKTTRGQLFPQLAVSPSVQREKVSEHGPTPMAGLPSTGNLFQATLNGSWEIDIWGRLRRSTEAARADLLSNEEGRRAVIMTLVASVANTYIDLRDSDSKLEIARSTARVRKESYELFKLRFEKGLISQLELSQAESEYEDTMATIPDIEKSIAQEENLLSVLLGRNPDQILRGNAIDGLLLPAVPAGLPSALLERRPDIVQAEQDLVSANARIGVAKAAFFPTISLTGFFGFSSVEISNLFTGPSKTWNWAVPVTQPIFTGGRLLGQLKSAKAQRRQALLNYQQTIQTAFREVDDALIEQTKTREKLEAQRRQLDALRDYARLARMKYENGYTSYIEVLDAERSLFNVELNYKQTQGDLFRALVNLYKSMGGGWIVEAENLGSPNGAVLGCACLPPQAGWRFAPGDFVGGGREGTQDSTTRSLSGQYSDSLLSNH